MSQTPMTTAQAKEKFLLILKEILRLKDSQDNRLERGAFLRGKADGLALICKLIAHPTPRILNDILDLIEEQTKEILEEADALDAEHQQEKQDAQGLLAMIEGFGENEPIN